MNYSDFPPSGDIGAFFDNYVLGGRLAFNRFFSHRPMLRSWMLDQPPLQYYMRAIEDQEWARVDVVTNGLEDEHHALNPVVPALEAKVADGELPGNIHFHKARPG